MAVKTCIKCKKNKQLTSFHRDKGNPDGLQSYCILCRKRNRKYSDEYKEKNKRDFLKYKYKLTIEDMNQMFIDQGRKCKICDTQYNKVSKVDGLFVDHCHVKGHVRGLLCRKCNSMLGFAHDNIQVLKKAIEYLSL